MRKISCQHQNILQKACRFNANCHIRGFTRKPRIGLRRVADSRPSRRKSSKVVSEVGEAAEFQDVVFSLTGAAAQGIGIIGKRPPTGQDGARAYAVQPWRSHRRLEVMNTYLASTLRCSLPGKAWPVPREPPWPDLTRRGRVYCDRSQPEVYARARRGRVPVAAMEARV